MELYGQEPEAGLLAACISRLEIRTVVDVGAERGAFVEAMLAAGGSCVHALEPESANAAFLRARFGGHPLVRVHECAVSGRDGVARLRLSMDPSGRPLSFGHTLLVRPDTDEIAWGGAVTVQTRSLSSLVDAGEIPARIGILKVDTEGHDMTVVEGLGPLESDIVMVEHWSDLPSSLGSCPWSTEEMVFALRKRGFSHFAAIVHRGDFVFLQWDLGAIPAGSMGNLVFLHDRVCERLLPVAIECASTLARRAVSLGETLAAVASERLAVIEGLTRVGMPT